MTTGTTTTTKSTRTAVPPPARTFSTLAIAEVVTWTFLILGMLAKYVLDLEVGEIAVRLAGGVHGFVFLTYCLTALVIAIDRGWRPGQLVTGWVSAVIPYATVPFERYAAREGLLGDHWRLDGAEALGPAERTVAAGLRHPMVAVGSALVVLALVFSGLLLLGPPTQWFE